jgi:hypothetical protein
VAVLVHGPPEIMHLPANADEDLVELPLFDRTRPAMPQCIGEHPTEAQHSIADRLVADFSAAGGKDRLNVARAQAEAAIQPDRVLDALGRKAKATA